MADTLPKMILTTSFMEEFLFGVILWGVTYSIEWRMRKQKNERNCCLAVKTKTTEQPYKFDSSALFPTMMPLATVIAAGISGSRHSS